jgi:ankyrin repeat protein
VLLELGLDPNIKNEKGDTPLHYACVKNLALVCLYLERGADVNAMNHHGESVLDFALLNGKPEIIRCLLKQGARRSSRQTSVYGPNKTVYDTIHAFILLCAPVCLPQHQQQAWLTIDCLRCLSGFL